jgi:hypothetical protein
MEGSTEAWGHHHLNRSAIDLALRTAADRAERVDHAGGVFAQILGDRFDDRLRGLERGARRKLDRELELRAVFRRQELALHPRHQHHRTGHRRTSDHQGEQTVTQ